MKTLLILIIVIVVCDIKTDIQYIQATRVLRIEFSFNQQAQ